MATVRVAAVQGKAVRVMRGSTGEENKGRGYGDGARGASGGGAGGHVLVVLAI